MSSSSRGAGYQVGYISAEFKREISCRRASSSFSGDEMLALLMVLVILVA